MEPWAETFASVDVVVDGILGTGVRGAPRERQAAAIERLNATGLPVLAIDVPSGIDSNTGAVPGQAVCADATVAFRSAEAGHVAPPGEGEGGSLDRCRDRLFALGPRRSRSLDRNA